MTMRLKSPASGLVPCALALAAAFVLSTAPAAADDAAADPAVAAAHAEIEAAFGTVPTFIKQFPKAGLPGAWAEVRDLELSDETALPPKVKALIALAVAAQIPCDYCVWLDTNAARAAGATDEEISEAVAMAALTRHWSTVFHGLQIDMDTFKAELGGE
jgi:AhpD family alkylhydroperoxidase